MKHFCESEVLCRVLIRFHDEILRCRVLISFNYPFVIIVFKIYIKDSEIS